MSDLISWDEALKQEGGFLKFETGARTTIAITEWSIANEEVTKYESVEKEIKPVLRAKVVGQDGERVNLVIRSQSKRLMQAFRPFLEGQSADDTVFLSVKKIGERTDTQYDVEKGESFDL